MALNTFGWDASSFTADHAGNTIPGVTLYVWADKARTIPVTALYADDGVTSLGGVVTSDADGWFGFKAADTYAKLYVATNAPGSKAYALPALEALTANGSITGKADKSYVDATFVTAATASSTYARSGVEATQRLMALLKSKSRNPARVLFIGDSTGNEPGEWIRLLTGQIATDWPNWTTRYRLWNDTTTGYDAAETVLTGTGAITAGVKVRDTFNRTTADLFGSTPDIGTAWTGASNAAGDWSTNGTQAVRTSDAATAPVTSSGGVQGDQSITFTSIALSTTGTGTARTFNVYPKYIDGSNYLWARIQIAADGSVSWNLFKTIAASNTTLATGAANPIAANTGSVTFNLTVAVTGATFSATIGAATMTATLSQTDQDFFMPGLAFGFSSSAAFAGMTIDQVDMTVTPLYPGPTLDVYNASVPGFACQSWQGTRFAPAIADLPPVDLIVLSMGHNESTSGTRDLWHSAYVGFTEQLTAAHPSADLICVAQNPETLNDYQGQRAEAYREIAARRGYGFIDAHQAFIDYGNFGADLLGGDGIHPNAAGSALWASVAKAAFVLQKNGTPRTQTPSTLTTTGEQILTNGDFSDFTASLPASWTAVGAPTVAKDTAQFENPAGWAVKVTTTAAGDGLQQTLPLSRVKGRWVTLAVRSYVPEGATGTGAGRVAIVDSDGSTTVIGRGYGMGAYRWQVVTRKIRSGATSAKVVLYGDTDTVGGTATFDRAILVEGRFPRMSATGTRGPAGAAGSNPGQLEFMSTLGNHPAAAMYGNTSQTFSTANQAVLVRFRPHRNVAVSELHWLCAAGTSGNYDIGVYDNAGTRLWSLGSTAWAAANSTVVATVSPALALTAGTDYYIALTGDNTTGTWRGMAESVTDQVKMLDGSYFSKTVPSAFPLPATITPGNSRAGKAPLITLHGT